MIVLKACLRILNSCKDKLVCTSKNCTSLFGIVQCEGAVSVVSNLINHLNGCKIISELISLGLNIIQTIETLKLLLEDVYISIDHRLILRIIMTKKFNEVRNVKNCEDGITAFIQIELRKVTRINKTTHICDSVLIDRS